MFLRSVLTALALCALGQPASAASLSLRCGGGNLSVNVTVDSPAQLDRDGKFMLQHGGGSVRLRAKSMSVNGSKVLCEYSDGGVRATYVYKIPQGWQCLAPIEHQIGRSEKEFQTICHGG